MKTRFARARPAATDSTCSGVRLLFISLFEFTYHFKKAKLCDFHLLERALDAIIGPLEGQDLNRTEPFDRLPPTAEHVADYIARNMSRTLPPTVAMSRVDVTEAPGCVAAWKKS